MSQTHWEIKIGCAHCPAHGEFIGTQQAKEQIWIAKTEFQKS